MQFCAYCARDFCTLHLFFPSDDSVFIFAFIFACRNSGSILLPETSSFRSSYRILPSVPPEPLPELHFLVPPSCRKPEMPFSVPAEQHFWAPAGYFPVSAGYFSVPAGCFSVPAEPVLKPVFSVVPAQASSYLHSVQISASFLFRPVFY